jgi:hypothetical protein
MNLSEITFHWVRRINLVLPVLHLSSFWEKFHRSITCLASTKTKIQHKMAFVELEWSAHKFLWRSGSFHQCWVWSTMGCHLAQTNLLGQVLFQLEIFKDDLIKWKNSNSRLVELISNLLGVLLKTNHIKTQITITEPVEW